jgi:adenine-specific DNA-methyltransferase
MERSAFLKYDKMFLRKQKTDAVALKVFLAFIRRHRLRIRAHGEPLKFCVNLINGRPAGDIGVAAMQLLSGMIDDTRDYAISSAFALLLDAKRRKQLSAYFTPPALTAAAMEAAAPFLEHVVNPSLLDPACGGGSFLVPTTRRLIAAGIASGLSPRRACAAALSQVRGIELDPGLAKLSRNLLANMLIREYDYKDWRPRDVVRVGDALSGKIRSHFDVVVGNPPYGRVRQRVDAETLAKAGRANLGGHTNLYALFLLRALDWVKPGGGLVFVLPTSFVAGPYFSGLRQEIVNRAKVLRIDIHEQRENLFLDAIQDVCLLTLQRHDTSNSRRDVTINTYKLGVIDNSGPRRLLGSAHASPGGEPWTLPVPGINISHTSWRSLQRQEQMFNIANYGYKTRVGKVVPTRERQRLRTKRGKRSLPLIWASDVRPDGTFLFGHGQRLGNPIWYDPPATTVAYATRGPALLLQRTSNRDQRRRLNAAAVPSSFSKQHHEHGFVAENHVIILETTSEKPEVSPKILAALLNSAVVNERFSAVCGSFSVSAKLLDRLALPDPKRIPDPSADCFETDLRNAFKAVGPILVPLELPGDPQDAGDETGDVGGSGPVDDDARFKRRAVA